MTAPGGSSGPPSPNLAVDGLVLFVILLLGVAANGVQLLSFLGLDGWMTFGIAGVLMGIFLVARHFESTATWAMRKPGVRSGIALLVAGTLLLVVSPIWRWLSSPPSSLPEAAAEVMYETRFEDPVERWRLDGVGGGAQQFTTEGYKLSAPSGGYAVWASPEALGIATGQRITATARLVDGRGGWGVWCRGDDADERYEFSVTHTGTIYIKTPGKTTDLRDVSGLDPYEWSTMTVTCADARGGGVDLSMAIGGVTISYTDRDSVLGPGRAGVHDFTFADVRGAGAVLLNHFTVERLS